MGHAELSHRCLCDAINAIFEDGQKRWSELELIHCSAFVLLVKLLVNYGLKAVKIPFFRVRHVGHAFYCAMPDFSYLYCVDRRHEYFKRKNLRNTV
jgi:hypothetical protein